MGVRRFLTDTSGSVVIETAFVVPVLAVLALGGFEASRIVARQTELQSAASEAAAVVLANPPNLQSERDTIEDIVEASTGLADDKVLLILKYRCGTANTLTDVAAGCSIDESVAEYIQIQMSDIYTPIWTGFGIGSPVNYNVQRRVQIS